MKKFAFIAMCGIISSCAHSIHQVHTSDFVKSSNGKVIQAKAEQFVILGFTKQTDYVDQAYASLLKQCPGSISGITTQISTSLSFLSWTNKALIQGICSLN